MIDLEKYIIREKGRVPIIKKYSNNILFEKRDCEEINFNKYLFYFYVDMAGITVDKPFVFHMSNIVDCIKKMNLETSTSFYKVPIDCIENCFDLSVLFKANRFYDFNKSVYNEFLGECGFEYKMLHERRKNNDNPFREDGFRAEIAFYYYWKDRLPENLIIEPCKPFMNADFIILNRDSMLLCDIKYSSYILEKL